MNRTCTVCKIEKSLDDFYEYKTHKTKKGYYLQCKSCYTVYNKSNYARNGQSKKWKDTNRNAHLKRNYGITIIQFNELLAKQHYKCKICDKTEDQQKNHFSVDHNHSTGEIRGLLCTFCNHKIVGFHEDGDSLRKIADYLDQGTGWYVPNAEDT